MSESAGCFEVVSSPSRAFLAPEAIPIAFARAYGRFILQSVVTVELSMFDIFQNRTQRSYM